MTCLSIIYKEFTESVQQCHALTVAASERAREKDEHL